MSTLKPLEKIQLEDLLNMGSGYVLDYSHPTFAELFRTTVNVDIFSPKYNRNGDSKVKRLRAYWEIESDPVVGKILAELLQVWEYKNPPPRPDADSVRYRACQGIAERLTGIPPSEAGSVDSFLGKNFKVESLRNLPVDPRLVPILQARFEEAVRCLEANAPLAVVVLSGSILEGLLLGAAIQDAAKFIQATSSPKDKSGNVCALSDWKLVKLIDVAHEVGVLSLDVKKFGHVLRDFRNYIHPYQQMSTAFAPDTHTARICLQVLRAAIASLSGGR